MEASAQFHRHLGCKTRPLSCTARFNPKSILRSLPYKSPPPFRLSVCMCIGGSSMETPGSETKTTLSYANDKLNQHIDHGAMKSYPSFEEQNGGKLGMDVEINAEGVNQQKKAAKIHDFCFGIPFGGLVISGGLVGFLFSRNPATLISGVFYGGALLALSFYSLKVWRQGKSSVPFILGQAALAATLLGKHFQMYTLKKKLFPTGFYTLVRYARNIQCFYLPRL
eukprot:TRINITY_DN1399_c0_g1_i3.p1 TRINITY_DN1399_c0_g1~~TRINITY_DN1399_c0_g1_i3.p1  ORF type:complete len:224 (-),score=34.28 TRINITY_DN1399_c0_g1_i3:41-712(-)